MYIEIDTNPINRCIKCGGIKFDDKKHVCITNGSWNYTKPEKSYRKYLKTNASVVSSAID